MMAVSTPGEAIHARPFDAHVAGQRAYLFPHPELIPIGP